MVDVSKLIFGFILASCVLSALASVVLVSYYHLNVQ